MREAMDKILSMKMESKDVLMKEGIKLTYLHGFPNILTYIVTTIDQ